jgi:hypothetical protein
MTKAHCQVCSIRHKRIFQQWLGRSFLSLRQILKLNGIEPENNGKEESHLKPRQCSRCSQMNATTFQYCGRCGMPLTEQASAALLEEDLERKEADRRLNHLIQDPEFRKMLLSKLDVLLNNGAQSAGV